LDLAGRLDDHSTTKAAFTEGLLSAAEATEVAKAADRNAAAEESLLATAKDKKKDFKDLRKAAAAVNDPDPAADARRAAYCRAKRAVRTWCDSDGLAHLHAQGGPESIAALWARIHGAGDIRFRTAAKAGERTDARHNLFDGLMDLVMGSDFRSGAGSGSGSASGSGSGSASGSGTGSASGSDTGSASGSDTDTSAGASEHGPGQRPKAGGGPRVDLMIVVDWEALRRGVALPGERCEIPGVGPVAVEVARSYLGEAALKFIVSDAVSVASVAHMGRHRGAHLRSALATMFDSCIDCGRSLGLEWDHVDPKAKGGPTSFENLRPRCRSCHRAKTARDFPEGTAGYRRRQQAIAERGPRRAKATAGRAAAGRTTGPSGSGPPPVSAASSTRRRT
jgi:hypothetical protein